VTKIILLQRLKDLTQETIADIIMPVAMQKGDAEPQSRAADVHLMRLPDGAGAKKKAPYVIHQVLTGKDVQPMGHDVSASATVRSIFAVYNEDEQEGGLMLLNIMERVRIRLLRQVVVGDQFVLDLSAGLETLVYPDDTAPYYAGEMMSVWKLPAVEREVSQWL
jgi:hypothetical protein